MNLAQLSISQKKPTMKQAQAIIRDIANGIHSETDLAKLYRYFMPATPKKPKTAFDWVAKAVPKNDVRYYLNYVYITDTSMIGTDGHRLHMADNPGLEPGFYLTNGDKAYDPDYAKYPDVDQIIPNIANCKKVMPADFELIEQNGLLVYDLGGVRVQAKYYNDCKVKEIYLRSKTDSALLTTNFGKAVIMPIRF